MRRPFMIPFLLAIAIGGYAAGFAHLHGVGCRHHEEFEQHLADVCAQAALRATGPAAKSPTPAPSASPAPVAN